MKTNLKKCAALTVILGISAFSVAGSALAARDNCTWYALKSAKQQQANLQKNCKFTGDEWSKNVREHRTYCENVSPDVWQSKIDERKKALDGCN